MRYDCCGRQMDFGPNPYVTNVASMAMDNPNFRTAIWTGSNVQMTLMSICPCQDIGLEIHEDTDQVTRIEQGMAVVKMGQRRDELHIQHNLYKGDIVFVPAGTWHNIINTGRMPLKISTIYAPPQHARGTIHHTKAEAEMGE